ncbi:MAG TPA: DUF488 domain-containing protein [Cellvibrionaceae bacterium]
MTVFTIGYEGLDVAAFMSLLKKHRVDMVIDVRELPLSRKPGFSKKALANVLSLSGLEYVHMVELGCPKPVRNQYREDGNWRRYTQGFLQYLKTQESAVAKLAEMAEAHNCALLCYEADSNYCHRSMVADAVSNHCGATVTHIKQAKATGTKTARSASLALAFA